MPTIFTFRLMNIQGSAYILFPARGISRAFKKNSLQWVNNIHTFLLHSQVRVGTESDRNSNAHPGDFGKEQRLDVLQQPSAYREQLCRAGANGLNQRFHRMVGVIGLILEEE